MVTSKALNLIAKLAKQVIMNGGIIALPTDTVYGLAADPFNRKAIEKLYKIKTRSDNKPIALLVSSKNAVSKFAKTIPPLAKKLMDKNWPGALTIIFDKKSTVPDRLTAGMPSIAIRMPDNKIALSLIKACGGALAVTSANVSGEKPAVNASEVSDIDGIDLLVDGGKCKIGKASSVVMVKGNSVEVLRKGPKLKL